MVRVRFAPSPTGPLHIGGVRTALYNYLFAKKNNGKFILRIEDTDQTRFVEGAEQYIIESLTWLGIEFDEGVHVGGNHLPYRQSERKAMYRAYADQLIQSGNAYIAFDTADSLDQLRKNAEAEKKAFQYDTHTRMSLCNSLTMTKEEVDSRISAGEPYVIRIKMPENTIIQLQDLIRGHVQANTTTLDDKVLFKSDGMPTYHLANVVDDYLMKITHVIRGEEWLPSAPLHVFLYQCFGWESAMPQFAHLPLLLKPDGNGKLSKRDGDRLGFPVFPTDWIDPKSGEKSSGYRESGYFPEAVVNILALLGWNSGQEKEIFSMQELIDSFTIDRISKSGAKFDLDKARWFNHQYLINKSDLALAELFIPTLEKLGISTTLEKVAKVISLTKDRCNFIQDFENQTSFFFKAPNSYDETVIKKRWTSQTPEILNAIAAILIEENPFSKSEAHDKVISFIKEQQLNMGQVMNCLRLSLVGEAKGPDLFEIIDFIGAPEAKFRIEKAISEISVS
jgi:glutamyl-tRNA synthetase